MINDNLAECRKDRIHLHSKGSDVPEDILRDVVDQLEKKIHSYEMKLKKNFKEKKDTFQLRIETIKELKSSFISEDIK